MGSGPNWWPVTRRRPFPVPPPVKRCRRCDTTKEAIDFHKSRGNRDGLKSWCIECSSAAGREYPRRRKARAEENAVEH